MVSPLSPQRANFDPGSVSLEFVVDKEALEKIFLRVSHFFSFSIIPPMLHTPSFVYMLLLLEGETGEGWELCRNRRTPNIKGFSLVFNPLKPELIPIFYLLALLAHHFLHVSRIRVKSLTIRLLMSYIYIWSTYS